MPLKSALFALPFLSATAMASSVCAPLIGSCDYYDCIEANLVSCGPQGYSLGYGGRYCRLFSDIDFGDHWTGREKDLFPELGNPWRDKTRMCLQQAIEARLEEGWSPTCQELRTFAFDAHPACFTEAPSFCFLPPRQVAEVAFTLRPEEYFLAETQKQVAETAAICAQQIDARLAAGVGPLMGLELSIYRNMWEVVAAEPWRFWTEFGGGR